MKTVKCGLVLCCLLFGICQADNGPPSLPPTVTIPVPKITTISTPITTLNPNETTTIITQKPTTPTSTTTENSTTSTSTTTTEKPTTTTSTPTTTPKPTTTTTPKPNTTTTSTTTTTPPPAPTPAPTPAPAPTPLPPATQGLWNHTENNITCIMVQFAGRLNVSYHINNSAEVAHALLNIPADANVTKGSCAPPQMLLISWPSAGSSGENSMLLQWTLNSTTDQYRLSTLNVTLIRDQEHFPNSSETGPLLLHVGVSSWEVPVSTSYRCDSPLEVSLTEDSGAVATLTVDKLQEEAYHNSTRAGFSAARTCAGPDLPDVVPIVVGCVLAGLVLVVLGAYLVARRRSTQGYLSM